MLKSVSSGNLHQSFASAGDNSYHQPPPSSSTQDPSDALSAEMVTEVNKASEDVSEIPPNSSLINTSKEKVDTSGGQRIKQSLRLPEFDFFCGSFDDQEIRFARQRVPGDGDCGFTALEMNRSDLRDVLIELSERQDIRNRLCDEVYEAFASDKIECTLEFTSLKDKYHRRQARFDQSLRDVRERNSKIPAFSLESDGRAVYSNSKKWLRENGKEEDAKRLQLAFIKTEGANTALMNYCKSQEAYRLYCEAYLNGLWLGCESAKIYAEQNHFRLFIWEQSSSQVHLILRHRTDSDQSKNRHLIFLNGNHFDRLHPIPFVKVQDSKKTVGITQHIPLSAPKRIFDVARDIFNPIKALVERHKESMMKCVSKLGAKLLDLVHKVSRFAVFTFFTMGLMMVIIENPVAVLSYNYGFCATAVFLITSLIYLVIHISRSRDEEKAVAAQAQAAAEKARQALAVAEEAEEMAWITAEAEKITAKEIKKRAKRAKIEVQAEADKQINAMKIKAEQDQKRNKDELDRVKLEAKIEADRLNEAQLTQAEENKAKRIAAKKKTEGSSQTIKRTTQRVTK